MRTVWLVRHAATAWSGRRWCGSTDLPLTSAGRQEAERLAVMLAEVLDRETLMVSSPSRRARETAESIAAEVGMGFEVDQRLREIDFGDAEGADGTELARRWPSVAAAIEAGDALVDWPDGESAAQVRRRAASLWSDLERSNGSLVLVTHGGFVRGLLAHVFPAAAPGSMVPTASATPLIQVDSDWTRAHRLVT